MEGAGERGENAVVPAAEIHLAQDGVGGLALLGGLGDFQDEGVATDLEGRGVEPLGLRLAPVPHGMEHREARAAEAIAAADAPVVLGGRREAVEARGDLGAALLVEPIEAAELLELAAQDVAQSGQVPDIERGVVEELGRDGALGPVGLLAGLVDGDGEVLLQERREADALEAEELGGEHRVEKAVRREAAEIVQQAQVEVAAVHDEVLLREHGPKRVELQAGREHIDEEDLAVDEELQEADPRLVVIHVVRLGIEGDLIDLLERVEERTERARLVQEQVGRRARDHSDAEHSAEAGREEAGNHAAGLGGHIPRGEEGINKQREVFVIAPLEQRGGGDAVPGASFGQPATEQGEILGLQRHRRDRIARVGVEAGGDEDEVGLERDYGIERGPQRGHVRGPWRARGNGPVAGLRAEVLRAGAGVARVLVDGSEENAVATVQDRLGAVAMVGVEIPDRHPPRPEVALREERGQRDLVEVAEAHRLGVRRVVAGRAHEREDRRLLFEGMARGLERSGDGATRMVADAGKEGRVRVEIARLREALQVGGRVGKQERVIGGERGLGCPPRPVRVGRAEVFLRANDARRLLRPHR